MRTMNLTWLVAGAAALGLVSTAAAQDEAPPAPQGDAPAAEAPIVGEAPPIYECCPEPTWIFEAGYINWRARRARTAFSGRINGLEGDVDGVPLDIDSHRIGLAETSYDRDNGYRLAIGRRGVDGWDVMFRYTDFDATGGKQLGDAAVDADRIYANLVDRSLGDSSSLNGLFDDGIVDYARERIELDYNTYDLEFGKQLLDCDVKARAFAGLRFADIDQSIDVAYTNVEPGGAFADVDEYAMNSEVDMSAWGFRLGGEMSRCVGSSGLSIFGRGSLSLLLAEFEVQRTDAAFNQSANDIEVRQYRNDHQSVVPVIDLAAGLMYERGRWTFRGGYEFANWFNMYQHMDIPGWDDIDDNTSVTRFSQGDLSFDGWFFEAGLTY